MLEHIGDVLGASFCQDDVKKCSSSLKIARNRSNVVARFRSHANMCSNSVCQQQRWQVLEHCANSRVRASVGTLSVLTVDVGVPTLERTPCHTRKLEVRGQVLHAGLPQRVRVVAHYPNRPLVRRDVLLLLWLIMLGAELPLLLWRKGTRTSCAFGSRPGKRVPCPRHVEHAPA